MKQAVHQAMTRIQDTIGSKIDIDGREMDIFALVLCGSSSFDGVDLAFAGVTSESAQAW